MIISYFEIYSLLLGSIGTLIVLKFWENYIRIGYDSKQKIQKLHTNISYRIGGITSIFFIVVLSFFGNFSYSLQIILLVFIPLISVSVIEDLFQNVAIKVRFMFMFITSVLLVYLTDSYFTETQNTTTQEINYYVGQVMKEIGSLTNSVVDGIEDGVLTQAEKNEIKKAIKSAEESIMKLKSKIGNIT